MKYEKPTLTRLDVAVCDILLSSVGLTVDQNPGDVSGDPIIFGSNPVNFS